LDLGTSAPHHPALGIDPGTARVGIAATDAAGILAHPVETIDLSRQEPLERIAELVAERGVRVLVVGLPRRLDGSEGPAADKARAFAERLRQRLPQLPLEFVDEFGSTLDAADKLRAAGRRAKRQRPVIDQAAAVEILERWMNE